jgi:cysteinyl-tRNA synthetase
VYFEVAKFPDYGKLSGRNVDEMIAGARVEVSPDKKAPADFALWKKAEPNHIMQWPSPWGAGFPGWHLECSVMSMKYLGKTIDIHGGGLENQFPHHDCEIAQSEAANGVQFVRLWMHNNMITVDSQKMGKSLNNFITLKQAFAGAHERLTRGYDPLAVRQLILNSHYRSPLDFSDAALFAAQSGYQKITEAVKAVRKRLDTATEGEADKKLTKRLKGFREKFESAMNDDLNTSVALSVLFELVRLTQTLLKDINTTVGTLNLVDVLFDRLGGEVLGIVKAEYPEMGAGDEKRFNQLVDAAVRLRDKARKKGDFEISDATRSDLHDLGIELKDGPEGTKWSFIETWPGTG